MKATMNKITLPVALLVGCGLLVTAASFGRAQDAAPAAPANEPYTVKVVAKDLRVVWSMVFASPDVMYFTERPGRVRIMEKGVVRLEPLLTLSDVDATGKLGALGLTLDPQFQRNRLLYLAYCYRDDSGQYVRVVRYRENNKTLTNRTVIIEKIPAATNHCGCCLRFGPDGKLYITTGDANRPPLAQQLDSLAGKILRLNPDGTIPQDNPFVGQAGARPEIWSYGHRNPQGLDWQPGTNTLFETEHGPTGGDEVNIIQKGKNYGWPTIHHAQTAPNMESPLLHYELPSPAFGSTIFYRGNAFPDFKNNLLAGCLRGEAILRVRLDGGKVLSQERLLEHRYGRLRDVIEAPDGSLYVSTSMFDPPEAQGREDYDQILQIVPVKVSKSF